MAGWFSAGNTAFDEQVEKATSSGLEDMAANLEICDLIRSKQVNPKDAMRSLKRRIGNKNPNVQLSALQLTDACVKNGGSHFLQEIASREFIDNLISIMNAPTQPINLDVKQRMLELIQAWAIAFEGQPQLSYVSDTYRLLKSDGHQFPPPPQQMSKNFVDSSAPPEWADSDVCMRCRTAFTTFNRKHHCRNCGNCFCGTCSSKTLPLLHIGIPQPVRVCDGCHVKLTNRQGAPKPAQPIGATRTFSPPASMQPRNARVEDDGGFEADLRLAMQKSLEEHQGGRASSGYVSHAQKTQQPPVSSQPTKQTTDEEEDDELKAAIAASLADMEEQKKKSAWNNPAAAVSAQPASYNAQRPDYELSPTEAENINLFSTLVNKLQSQPPGTILREPGIQELYEGIGKLRPKLARTFGETMSKYEALCDLHAKLSTVVRYYDKMLEDRLSYTYFRHAIGGTSSYAGRQSYASVPQNAESFYGAQFSSPAPHSETPYSRPQSTYQMPPTQRQPYQQTPQTQYAQPTAPGAQESQKYNMYPSMPSQPSQQPPSAYPSLSSPPPQHAYAVPPQQQAGLANGQPAAPPQAESQPPVQTPRGEYPPSMYPSMPPQAQPQIQTPHSEYSTPAHQQVPQQLPSLAQTPQDPSTQPQAYPPQEQYTQQYPPQQPPSQQQPSYPPPTQEQPPQQYWQYQQQTPQEPPSSATPSYPPQHPQSVTSPPQWQAQAPPTQQPPPQQQPVSHHQPVQESVPATDFYPGYPPPQQQNKQGPQAAYYQVPPTQKSVQPQPVVEESLIDL